MNRDIPFGYTLLTASTVCFGFWSVALNPIQYVGTLAFMGFQLCCACWLVIGVVRLVKRVRRAFTYASHDLADFVRGKGKKESLQVERLKAVRAAIAEAKARKEAASKGLKQPNQSSTVRYLNERLSALICEQLQLEGALERAVEAK